jgi:integrase
LYRDDKRAQAPLGELGDKLERQKQYQKITFNDVLNWYQGYEGYEGNIRFTSKPSYKNELIILKAFRERAPELCKKSILDLELTDLIDYRNRRKADGCSNAAINREFSVLRHMLKWGRLEGGFRFDDSLRDLKNLPEGPGRDHILTREDEEKLFKAIGEQCRTPPLWSRTALLVAIALTTALRKGVILKLKWGDVVDVDGERKVFRIPRSYWNGKKRAPPEAPICLWVRDWLETYRDQLPEQDRTPTFRLFPTKTYTRLKRDPAASRWLPRKKLSDENTVAGYNSTWKRIVERAGLYRLNEDGEKEYLRFHDLRHTATTRYRHLKPKPLSPMELDYLLGHSGGTTGRYANHDPRQTVLGIADKIDAAEEDGNMYGDIREGPSLGAYY